MQFGLNPLGSRHQKENPKLVSTTNQRESYPQSNKRESPTFVSRTKKAESFRVVSTYVLSQGKFLRM